MLETPSYFRRAPGLRVHCQPAASALSTLCGFAFHHVVVHRAGSIKENVECSRRSARALTTTPFASMRWIFALRRVPARRHPSMVFRSLFSRIAAVILALALGPLCGISFFAHEQARTRMTKDVVTYFLE